MLYVAATSSSCFFSPFRFSLSKVVRIADVFLVESVRGADAPLRLKSVSSTGKITP
jgi:hypothetical protein